MDVPDRNQATSWEGKQVVDRDGEPLGTCRGVFADTETGVTEWLDVDVDGGSRSFVPALEAVDAGEVVRVAFLRAAVLSAPAVGDQEQLSKRDETELYRHYDVPVATGGSVLPTDAPADAGGAPFASASSTGTLASTDDVAPTGVLPSTSDDTTAGVFAAGRDRPALDAETERSDADAGASASADGDTALGEHALALDTAGTPETGEDLPVLDPAKASVPIPEDEVVYVDDREPFMEQSDRGEPDPEPAAPEPAAPRLSRVPQEPAPGASSWPPPSSQGPDALSTGAPLAGLAGLAAAVYLVLHALEERRRRRNSPAARADRVRRQVEAGSRAARASAARSLAAGGAAAVTTGRHLSASASAASRDAAKKQRELAAAAATASRDAAKKRRELAASASTASRKAAEKRRKAARKAARKASRQAARQQRQLAASLSAASAAAARTGAAATGAVAAVPAAIGSSLSDAAHASSKATSRAGRRGRSTSSSLASAPRKAARKGRRLRRSVARKAWELVLATAAGGGYVLGAKAGRERYDEITDVASAVAASPQVQRLTETVTDPERRGQLVSRVTSRLGR